MSEMVKINSLTRAGHNFGKVRASLRSLSGGPIDVTFDRNEDHICDEVFAVLGNAFCWPKMNCSKEIAE